jgi:L-fuconolactonase
MSRYAPNIVDAHVHFWNPNQFRYAWLDDLPALRHAMLPADFAKVSESAKVSKFIFVECGCESSQSLKEVDWANALADIDPRLKGIIAHAALERGKAVREDLEILSRHPLVKGVRRNLQGEPVGFLQQPGFVEGLKMLPEFDFTFDLCVRADQLLAATELVRSLPEVKFVLDHFGKPSVRNDGFEPWASDLRMLAEVPNIFCKISGLTTEANWNDWRPDDLAPYFNHTMACFGPERVMFGSDWPVATLATSYGRWVETVFELVPANERELTQLFQTNTERIYRV